MVGRRQSRRQKEKLEKEKLTFCGDVPRNRKCHKGEKLNKWSEKNMKDAIMEWQCNPEVSYRRIAQKWDVPYATLFKRTRKGTGQIVFRHLSGRNTILSSEQETELVDLIKLLSQRGFPLSKPDIQRLAFEYATRNGISGFSSCGHNAAGYVWFKLFMKRHPELCVRKPENLSTARAAAVNETVIMKWFADYKALAEKLGIIDQPDRFWNCDESGLQYQFDQGMVVGEVGKPCYRITPGEKSETTTVLAAFNAAGDFAPPFIIFKGKRVRSEWCTGSPPNTTVKCSDNGWITTDLLVSWAENFLKIIPDDAAPRILILDGHVTHTYNLRFLEMMKDRHIEVICLPAHSTHLLQAADKSFFRSLKFHWNSHGKTFIRKSGGAYLPKTEFFNVFSPAWTEAAKPETAISGFKSTCTWPIAPELIPKDTFLPSLTTERPPPPSAETIEPVVQDQAVDDSRPMVDQEQHADSQCDELARQVAVSEATGVQSLQSCSSYICVPLSSLLICNDVTGFETLLSTDLTMTTAPVYQDVQQLSVPDNIFLSLQEHGLPVADLSALINQELAESSLAEQLPSQDSFSANSIATQSTQQAPVHEVPYTKNLADGNIVDIIAAQQDENLADDNIADNIAAQQDENLADNNISAQQGKNLADDHIAAQQNENLADDNIADIIAAQQDDDNTTRQSTVVACANRRVLSEMQSYNNSNCSFFDLCAVPKRERKPIKRRTMHNFLLTSDSHLQFVKDSIEKKKPRKSQIKNLSAGLVSESGSKKNAKKEKVKEGHSEVKSSGKTGSGNNKQKNAGTGRHKVSRKCKKTTADAESEEQWVCAVCKGIYGDCNDKFQNDAWYPCVACHKKFHETCAEDYGIIDDDETYTCKDCI